MAIYDLAAIVNVAALESRWKVPCVSIVTTFGGFQFAGARNIAKSDSRPDAGGCDIRTTAQSGVSAFNEWW